MAKNCHKELTLQFSGVTMNRLPSCPASNFFLRSFLTTTTITIFRERRLRDKTRVLALSQRIAMKARCRTSWKCRIHDCYDCSPASSNISISCRAPGVVHPGCKVHGFVQQQLTEYAFFWQSVIPPSRANITKWKSWTCRHCRHCSISQGCDVSWYVMGQTKRTNQIWICIWFGDTKFAIFP